MGARIQLIGPLAVLGADGTVTGSALAGRRVQLVLIALASTPGGLTSSALADRLWEEPPSTWAAALRGTVLSLRTALEPIGLGGQTLVRTTANGWALDPDADVDLVLAAEVVTDAERALSEGRPESALDAIAVLGDLTGGELLPEEDAAWIAELRSRIDSVVGWVLGVEAEAALQLGRHAAAAAAARRLLDRNPLDERAHRTLISALAASGDRAGAIRAFEDCRTVLAEQLGMDPSTETTAAYLEVLRSGSSGASGNLPAPPRNGFFGRQEEFAALVVSLREPGVVSLLGRGGVGKSRLALHAAQSVIVDSPGNRFWVTLGDLTGPGLVAVTIARAISADDGPDPLPTIISALAPLGESLLVLDGCEEVLDGVAEVLEQVMPAVPGLRVLATSRRALDVSAERKVELAPLRIPSTADAELARSAAVQLLSDRMAERGQTLHLDARNAPAVQQLCSRCGGIPLALELAAAQLGSMAVADLLDVLPAATYGAGDVVETLLEQSYQSLGDDEAQLFRAWGAVEGALPLTIASALTEAPTSGRAARLLTELAERGLLEIDRSGPRWRYRQDDQVRHFARERLARAEGVAPVLEVLAVRARSLLPEDARTPPGSFREAVTDAVDAFRTVFEASTDGRLPRETGLELAFRLHRYWAVAGIPEGRYWLRRLVRDAEPGEWTSYATFAAGYLAYWAGDTDGASVQLEAAARLLAERDQGFAARSLMFAAGIADDQDRPDDALRDIRAAVALAEAAGDTNLLVSTTVSTASVLAERGDPEAADHAQRALAMNRDLGTADQLLAALATTAMICWQVGAVDAARDAIRDADALFRGEARIARTILATAAAGVEFTDGNWEQAARYAELAVSDGEELGVERELPLAHALRARIALARGRRAEAARSTIDSLASAGRLDYDYPIALCLETAAVVLGDDADTATLVATAAALRRAGDRPAPAGMRLEASADAEVQPLREAMQRAIELLEPLAG